MQVYGFHPLQVVLWASFCVGFKCLGDTNLIIILDFLVVWGHIAAVGSLLLTLGGGVLRVCQ